MHISLDSALGRQRRLNSVGESVFQIAPNAAAGYSLRSLTGGDPAVVRVRRASDNSEKDFNSSGVSSGELVNWVNAQIVPPLDVRELVDGERTGALIPAAAAYSLRNLSTSYTGNVVDVRRSSDDAEDSFTAAEVADGTLTDWVNTDPAPYNSDFSAGVDGFTATRSVVTGDIDGIGGVDDTLRFIPNVGSNATSFTRKNGVFTGEQKSTISFDYYFPSTNSAFTGFAVLDGTSGGSAVLGAERSATTDAWTTVTFTDVEPTQNNLQIFAADADQTVSPNGTDLIYFKNFTITQTTDDGFVSTWYDQSGNANDAVQATATSQPKIVDAGVLVTGGIDFDGVDDYLDASGVAASLSGTDKPLSSFAVVSSDVAATTQFVLSCGRASTSTPIKNTLFHSGNNLGFQVRDNANALKSNLVSSPYSPSTTYLVSNTSDGLILDFAKNGLVTSNDFDVDVDALTIDTVKIGARANSSSGPLNGRVQEIIIYNSDQSANRTAFEANIGETYGIDLPSGVDTGYDQVDGFVETWYDQSGNGNDATQSVAASQPKIVDAGVFLGEVDFDGANDYLQTTNSDLCNVAELSVFSVLKPHIASSQVVAFSCGSVVAGSSAYGGWKLNLNGYVNQTQFQTQAIGDGIASAVGNSIGGNDTLVSYIADFPDSSAFANGQAGSSSSSTVSPNNSSISRRRFRIGCQFTYQASGFYTKPIKEIILYTSDQSANRAAIETNINNQYDIY
ncbi:hypothetical protein N9V86_02565 [Opitutales bacterium]|nr:hypothetical protein [Opitutales bacterium]